MKETIQAEAADIREAIEQKKLIIGTDRTMRALKEGKLSKVYIASNCPEQVKKEIKYLSSFSKVNVIELTQSNQELGAICKKQFLISVVSV